LVVESIEAKFEAIAIILARNHNRHKGSSFHLHPLTHQATPQEHRVDLAQGEFEGL